MSRSFIVCAPTGGKKHTVRASADMPLLKVLEEACQKLGLKAEQFVLKQGRTVIDLTKPVRLSNIPNNAKLDLVQEERGVAASQDAEVGVALQLPDGKRIKGKFMSSSTLWSILAEFDEKEGTPGVSYRGFETPESTQGKYLQAVCRYLRQEFDTNKALKKTTLRDLGVTSGSVALQLIFRALGEVPNEEEEEEETKHVEEPVADQGLRSGAAVNEEASGGHEQEQEQASGAMPMDTLESESASRENPAAAANVNAGDGQQQQQEQQQPPRQQPQQQQQQQQTPPQETSSTQTAMASRTPSDATEQPRKKERKQEDAAPASSMLDVYPEIRSMISTPWSFDAAKEKPQKPARVEVQPEISRHYIPPNRYIPGEAPEIVDFSNFKFPDPPAKSKKDSEQEGKSASKGSRENEGQDSDTVQQAAEKLPPLPREALIFTLEGASDAAAHEAVPDDFFELTLHDLQTVLRDVQKVNDTERDLETKAMRDKRQKELEERYKIAVVRVYFPNRMVIQGRFWCKETLGDVRKFVAEHLEDPALPFYLYTSPPRVVYEDPTQTLVQAKLAPYANIRFGSQSSDPALKSVFLESPATYEEAAQRLRKIKADSAEKSEGQKSHTAAPAAAARGGAHHSGSNPDSDATRAKLLKHLGVKK